MPHPSSPLLSYFWRKRTRSRPYEEYAERLKPFSPRVRTALHLYEAGLVSTKKEAARAVGLTPMTVYQASSPKINGTNRERELEPLRNELRAAIVESVQAKLRRMSERALDTIEHIMDNGELERNRLAAARDLADRGPETAKIQKHQVESLTLTGKDVERLASGIAEAARIRAAHAAGIQPNLVLVPGDQPNSEAITPQGSVEAVSPSGEPAPPAPKIGEEAI